MAENKEVKKPFLLDLDQILKDRKIKLPGFVTSYLKKVVHQDECNSIISDYNDFEGVEFVDKILYDRFQIKSTTEGIEYLEKDKKYIFVANHPIGGLDGLLFVSSVYKAVGQVKAIVNDLLLNIHNLRPLFVGVNLYGGKSRESAAVLDQAFASDDHILIFPAGMVSRKHKGVVKDLEWKPTFVKKAIRYHREVVPVYIDGGLSKFFYRLYSIRKFFGIKFNIEMLYLSDETYKQKKKTINIRIGQPIPYSTFNSSKTAEQWAESLKEYVYSLKEGPKDHFF